MSAKIGLGNWSKWKEYGTRSRLVRVDGIPGVEIQSNDGYRVVSEGKSSPHFQHSYEAHEWLRNQRKEGE